MGLGDLIGKLADDTIGVVYQDNGFSISNSTEEGKLLMSKGTYYICPHGRCCTSITERENWCPECRRESESSQMTVSQKVKGVKTEDLSFVFRPSSERME